MTIPAKKYVVLLAVMLLMFVQAGHAGPPFNTDDPEPVPFKHWEYYISSINTLQPGLWSGTSPHFEVNYGVVPSMQIHLLLPFNYTFSRHQPVKFGYADSELGIKYCFIQETENRPQIGTFPIFEIPTLKNEAFSNGKTKIFIPLWAQKSFHKFTTYGGLGYWINPGKDNRNSVFSGWEIQYDFSKVLMLGGEIYFQSADAVDSKAVAAFNIGGSINTSEKMHLIFSFGHSLTNKNFFTAYLGLLWTI